jgi:O-antigen/teichoic acid export membrane protein
MDLVDLPDPTTRAPMPTAATTPGDRPAHPVLSRLLRGTFWLALRTPLQALFALYSVRLILRTIGEDACGAYTFAWGFGFLQFLLEFGSGPALQRRIAEAWAEDDREGVHRAVACGLALYAGVALLQAMLLLAIAYFALPHSEWQGESYRLIVQLLWLQAIVAPGYGLSMVLGGVLQAARRYEVMPRLELFAVILRFTILVVGLNLGFPFFPVVAVQAVVAMVIVLGGGAWVMVRHVGYVPRLGPVRLADFLALGQVGFAMFLMQVSVVLSDKMDTTILGFALADPGPANAIYAVVSKPFLQLRQTGWMLASLVMPAAASLVVARDHEAIERVTYDGSRLLIGLLLPVGLLATIHAAPFLMLWVGPRFAREAWLMRLFLIAALPLLIAIPQQIAIARGRFDAIAIASLIGSMVNLPVSYVLTIRLGVAGVIWGSVLTVIVANLIVPGWYVFRLLDIRPAAVLTRTLGPPLAGSAALVIAAWAFGAVMRADPPAGHSLTWVRAWPLIAHLGVGVAAYLVGYATMPDGRGDLARLARRVAARAA